ncbi:MAG: peptide chain release factor N(5)-glutamine methyltransferase [Planctomycetes bacterium]|nr:peptide chain release factor N(5)-glutamine methyltransferase [Planctomycetota bacterium]
MVAEEVWTTVKILKWTTEYFRKHHVAEPRLDAELLLSAVLGVERISLYTHFDRQLADDELARFRALVEERAAGRPAKYITGRTEFYSRALAVDERVLIPRPETEIVVERALAILTAGPDTRFPLVADICTGNGAIAVALATNFTGATYIATDSSPGAVEVARDNAVENGVREKIEFLIGDLFDPLVTMGLEGKVDLVVSNPPYVSEAEWTKLPREIRKYEPRAALVAGADGTEIQKRLLDDARTFLCPGGTLLLEMDSSQREALEETVAGFEEYALPTFHQDYARHCRVLEVETLQ